MAISPELMLALLAMDAYNRGYNAGIRSAGAGAREGLTGGQLGDATIGILANAAPDEAASFLAISCRLTISSPTRDGPSTQQTVISCRGADQTRADVANGYGTGARGLPAPGRWHDRMSGGEQGRMAVGLLHLGSASGAVSIQPSAFPDGEDRRCGLS